MESEEITKMVDGVYKNILEKFNPGARQLISTGKGYLKALHGAASASRLFNEALAKLAMNAQQSGTNDIGAALMNVVSVYKEIQEQQMNILKAFYVDLLVPLETNLEKDTKVVQHEQKKFLQQHKVRMESYQKAVSTMKKQRKKKASAENTEKELRNLQILEDQKKKLDTFCEQSYKNAMTQERRRYGFVLERQCSIAKHWMAYHSTGKMVIDNNLENWQEIAASREVIPAAALYEMGGGGGGVGSYSNASSGKRMERLKDGEDMHAVGNSSSSQLKKSRSVDAPYGDMRTLHESHVSYTQNSLPRAKSDYNLTTVTNSNDHTDHGQWDQRPVVKALYAYMPSGENQLPFDEGDRIALVGSKAKGWQFGENLRTQMFGWFPIAYTNAEGGGVGEREKYRVNERHTERSSDRYENVHYERNGGMRNYQDHYMPEVHMDPAMESDSTYRRRNNSAEESSPTRMFGDTFRNQKKYRASASGANPRPGPPPTLPAPVPSNSQNQSQSASRILNTSQSFCGAPNGVPSVMERRKQHKLQNGPQAAHSTSMSAGSGGSQLKPAAAAKTSLHSSNDSGFANEPPPQPEIDYSDEEQTSRVPIRRRADTNSHISRDVTSWTLNRNFRNSVDSQIDDKALNGLSRRNTKMRYDLIASDDEILQASSSGIKRTKSFWKFGGRGEDILAGMSLWQHRDLVAAPNLEDLRTDSPPHKENGHVEHDDEPENGVERERERDRARSNIDKNGTLTKSHSNNSTSSAEKRRNDSVTSMEVYDDDENIYGMSPAVKRENIILANRNSIQSNATTMRADYTPKSRMKIMKTIEIDIENPIESERLSTIKRGQKEYQKEYRETAGMLPQVNINSARASENKNKSGTTTGMQSSRRDTMSNSHKKHQTNNVDANVGKHASLQQMKSSGSGGQPQTRGKQQDFPHSTEDEDADSDDNGTLKMSDVNNFFDDISHENTTGGMIMKTVKRKDILKQYYTSEDESDDVEIKSTSSDPYDCIVINDHLVRKDEKHRRQLHNSYQEHQMEFQTFRATTTSAAMQQQGGNKKNKLNGGEQRNGSGGGGGGGGAGGVAGGGKSKKQQELHEQERERDRERERERDRYSMNNSSTLTRNSNVNANSVMNTPTATILPRTRLMKSSNMTSMTLERASKSNKSRENGHASAGGGGGGSDKERHHYGKTYGPWYDFWDQQDQNTLVSRKSMNNGKI
ncbi:general transcriptional corepressor trfA-like isoform X2 [Rhagoletis pomonella]|uniref:general transcriptional corepressor trfA-like isoform X2 n=1 Tax=Rhagoletis pomonella TaxID=28610 RepID=UPI001781EE9B|nr:general transcriptional corepressor trfA-like isoform X2 [Rhagoletis pomonella]